VKIQVEVFCVVTQYSDVVGYQRFGGSCCLHLQGEGDVHLHTERHSTLFAKAILFCLIRHVMYRAKMEAA